MHKENYLKMKLRYRIRLAYYKWKNERRRKREVRETRQYLAQRILRDLSEGETYRYWPSLHRMEDYEAAFKILGVKYTIGKDGIQNFIQASEEITWK